CFSHKDVGDPGGDFFQVIRLVDEVIYAPPQGIQSEVPAVLGDDNGERGAVPPLGDVESLHVLEDLLSTVRRSEENQIRRPRDERGELACGMLGHNYVISVVEEAHSEKPPEFSVGLDDENQGSTLRNSTSIGSN